MFRVCYTFSSRMSRVFVAYCMSHVFFSYITHILLVCHTYSSCMSHVFLRTVCFAYSLRMFRVFFPYLLSTYSSRMSSAFFAFVTRILPVCYAHSSRMSHVFFPYVPRILPVCYAHFSRMSRVFFAYVTRILRVGYTYCILHVFVSTKHCRTTYYLRCSPPFSAPSSQARLHLYSRHESSLTEIAFWTSLSLASPGLASHQLWSRRERV